MTQAWDPRVAAHLTEIARQGLRVQPWTSGPHAAFALHDHPYAKVLVVAQGSMTFTIEPGRRQVAMRVGDRLDLPAGTQHSAIVSDDGVDCLEAHRG